MVLNSISIVLVGFAVLSVAYNLYCLHRGLTNLNNSILDASIEIDAINDFLSREHVPLTEVKPEERCEDCGEFHA